MVSKTILTAMLVVAVGLAPTATSFSFDLVETPALSFATGAIDAPHIPSADGLIPNVPDAESEVDKITDTVDSALMQLTECQMAVHLPVTIFYGNRAGERTQEAAFIAERDLTTIVETIQEPIYGTVEEVVWEPTGLLGFLDPVIREHVEIIGYETKKITEEIPVDARVDITWDEFFLDWQEPVHADLYLPAFQLPFWVDVGGQLEYVCGETVETNVPNYYRAGYDFIHVHVGTEQEDTHEDAWYMEVFSVEVIPASEADRELPSLARGYSLCPGAAMEQAETKVSEYLDQVDPALSKTIFGGSREGTSADEEDASSTEFEPNAAATLVVPPSTLAFLALVAVAVLAAAGFVAYKRFRPEE